MFKLNFVLSTISFHQATLKSLLSEHDWEGGGVTVAF